MGYVIQQNQSTYPLVFDMYLSSDHITPAIGLSPTVVISKDGASYATPAGAVTEIGNGSYQVAANATDANTAGPLLLYATAATADSTKEEFFVSIGVVLATNGVDQVLIETGVNLRQATSAILSACAGILSGAGTGTITIKGANVGTTRITASTDSSGNRTAISLSLPS